MTKATMMYFFKQNKVKATIENPYNVKVLPKALPADILEKLVIQLKEGDLSVEQKIIESHLRLGISIVSRYIRRSQVNRDDYIGEMQLAIAQAVRWVAPPESRLNKDNNITPYITTTIHSFIHSYYEQTGIVHMTGSSRRYYNKLNDIRVLDAKINCIAIRDLKEENKSYRESKIIIPTVHDDKSVSELMEMIDKVLSNFIEKRIIELRAQGYTYEEVGKQVGLGTARVGQIVLNIHQKLVKRFGKKYA